MTLDLVAQTNMGIVQSPFAFERCGLTLAGDLTFEDCLSCAKSIDSVESSKHWWIGDLLNHVEAKYGDKYKEFVEQFGLEYGTLANDKYIASKIEFSRRRENSIFEAIYL